jgi:hypothetical protein
MTPGISELSHGAIGRKYGFDLRECMDGLCGWHTHCQTISEVWEVDSDFVVRTCDSWAEIIMCTSYIIQGSSEQNEFWPWCRNTSRFVLRWLSLCDFCEKLIHVVRTDDSLAENPHTYCTGWPRTVRIQAVCSNKFTHLHPTRRVLEHGWAVSGCLMYPPFNISSGLGWDARFGATM